MIASASCPSLELSSQIDLALASEGFQYPRIGGRDIMAKILVAAANDGIRNYLTTGLEADGHEVFAAATNDEVLDQISEERFDLVIADVFLPVLEGVALIATIARACRSARIIALTDFKTARAHTYDLSCWVDSSISKPFCISRVLSEVEFVLHHEDRRTPVSPVQV